MGQARAMQCGVWRTLAGIGTAPAQDEEEELAVGYRDKSTPTAVAIPSARPLARAPVERTGVVAADARHPDGAPEIVPGTSVCPRGDPTLRKGMAGHGRWDSAATAGNPFNATVLEPRPFGGSVARNTGARGETSVLRSDMADRIGGALVRLLTAAVMALTVSAAPANTAPPDIRLSAVIYTDDDQAENNFRSIIAGMADNPEVQLYRVVLGMENDASPGRRPSVKLAFNTGTGSIAVIYPDIGEPYRSVFEKIIEGIEDKTHSKVLSYSVGANPNLQDLTLELKRQDVRVVIALGRNGLKAASSLDMEIGVVASGVLAAPETESRAVSVFSLAPDPILLFSRLKSLSPSIRRVHVVVDPRQNGWLLRHARDAARADGIELVVYEAGDLKTAVGYYRDILAAADPRRDALWLPQDTTTVEETTVLPLVLQESWNRGLAVFSSSVAHVKRGVLFSLYPNNVELGRNLASSALGYISSGGGGGRGLVPLKEVLLAVNVRTAGHLGLDVSLRQSSFDMVFPEP